MGYTREEFIKKIAPIVINDRKDTGILASVTIAQAVLESSNGNSSLASKYHNLFGMKGDYKGKSINLPTKEEVQGKLVDTRADFRVYPSWDASIEDHSKLLCGSRYNLSGVTDYRSACQTLQNCGYATSSAYASNLTNLIQQHSLYQFDTGKYSGNAANTIDYGQRIVQIALGQQGNPGGQKFWSWWGYSYPVAWCAIFVSWCAEQAGITKEIIPREQAVYSFMQFAKSNNLFQPKGSYTPKAGDVFIHYDNGSQHTGIVIDSDGTAYHTIEGNTSDTCARRSYSLGNPNLTGFFTPNYPKTVSDGNESQDKEVYAKTVLASIQNIRRDKAAKKNGEVIEFKPPVLHPYQYKSCQLVIFHKKKRFIPVVEDDITWSLERKGTPGKLKFTVIPDKTLKFTEGDAVQFHWNKERVFYGFIFEKNESEDGKVEVTCFDQLRYLKNKDTYVYQDKTAGDLIKMLARQFALNVGTIEDTKYKIPSKIEDNKTLFDMINDALDDTLVAKKDLYVLYDDFGKLTLKNINRMKTNILIDKETAQSYSYSTGINGDTYNKVKLSYSNNEEKARELYIARDPGTINQWGVLQYYEQVDSDLGKEAMEKRAASLLKIYDYEEKSLRIDKCFGDLRVRAGSSVVVSIKLHDQQVKSSMMAEKVTHRFGDRIHTMDLTLRGGAFFA